MEKDHQELSDILMNAPIGIFKTSPQGRFLSANIVCAQYLGYSTPQELTDSVTDIAAQIYADHSDRERVLGLLTQNEEVVNYECRFLRRDGSDFWVNITLRAIRASNGKIAHYQGFAVDITKRKQAEEALLHSEKYYRAVFEISGAAQIIIEDDTTISLANSRFEELTGYSRKEIEGQKSWTEFIHPDDVLFMKKNHQLRRYEPGNAPRKYEFRLIDRHGEMHDIFLCVDLIPGTTQSVASCIDISDRKQAEKERERLQLQLLHAQKMESIGRLAGGVAHDFNNLLQAMSGNVQLLLMGKENDHPDAPRLKTIAKSIDRSAHLVRQLLIFSRKSEAQRQRVDLNREVQEAAKILERTIPRMIRIELQLEKRLLPVHADPAQVELLLLNLGNNAAHAMSNGGQLVIQTKNVVLDENYAHAHAGTKPGRYVLMSVEDTGCGMDSNTLEHIFDPFFTTKEVGTGTGLGLASVYGIVNSHDGIILCLSEQGRGTTFQIFWPVMPGPVEAKHAPPMNTVMRKGTESILVADDEEVIREVTREVLENSGYTVITAASGEEALSLFAEKGRLVDMVILDLSMPGMGGRQCLEELMRINPAARVLISSGYSPDGPAQKISKVATGFISKPYQLAELLAKVRQVLDDTQDTTAERVPSP